jgi:energy-coupling factor transporter ATP-binding protein EcfA2
MIRLENVTYRYRHYLPPALLNVNLEISEGESVCVMGANGSGKSTLSKLIAGLLKNQQGRFYIQTDPHAAAPVGLLFQNPDNQMVAVTVEKEIAFALENQGIPQTGMEKRINQALSRLSILQLRNRLTNELSVGEKQRVALAAVLVSEPAVLILDEPDSYLDRDGKQLFRKLLEKIKNLNSHLTIIEISQYPGVAQDYDRLIVFHQGRIVADDEPSTILENKKLCVKYGIEFDRTGERHIAFPQELQKEIPTKNVRVAKVALERVSFAYPGNETTVIAHFTGEFRQGEITAIVGPSGSGKSTLGMLICGINDPSSGAVTFLDGSGQPVDCHKSRGQMTASLQQPERQFFLHSSQAEVEFGPRNFGLSVSTKSVKDFFGVVGLPFEQFALRDPFTL